MAPLSLHVSPGEWKAPEIPQEDTFQTQAILQKDPAVDESRQEHLATGEDYIEPHKSCLSQQSRKGNHKKWNYMCSVIAQGEIR